MLSYAEWQRLSNVPSFGSLLAASPFTDDDLERSTGSLRDVDL